MKFSKKADVCVPYAKKLKKGNGKKGKGWKQNGGKRRGKGRNRQ